MVDDGTGYFILDEPTRGIDVGAKYEIYTIIEEMASAGKAICIISSELPELLGMCDRIYTMNEGRFTGSIAARCGSRTADELDDIRREWGLGWKQRIN